MSRIAHTMVSRRDRHDCRKPLQSRGCIERWYYRLAPETFAADPSLLVGSHDTGKTAELRRLGAMLEAQYAMSSKQPSESGLARTPDSNPATEELSS